MSFSMYQLLTSSNNVETLQRLVGSRVDTVGSAAFYSCTAWMVRWFEQRSRKLLLTVLSAARRPVAAVPLCPVSALSLSLLPKLSLFPPKWSSSKLIPSFRGNKGGGQ